MFYFNFNLYFTIFQAEGYLIRTGIHVNYVALQRRKLIFSVLAYKKRCTGTTTLFFNMMSSNTTDMSWGLSWIWFLWFSRGERGGRERAFCVGQKFRGMYWPLSNNLIRWALLSMCCIRHGDVAWELIDCAHDGKCWNSCSKRQSSTAPLKELRV